MKVKVDRWLATCRPWTSWGCRSIPRDLAGSDAPEASVWFLLSASVVAVAVLNKCEISFIDSENVCSFCHFVFSQLT